MKALKILAIGAIAALTLAGCSKSGKQKSYTDSRLESVVWQLVKFDGNDYNKPDKYEISFLPTGRFAGIGECNRFFGTYEVINQGGGIKMSGAGATMMACLDANIESQFFGMFENVRQYQFDGNYLYLFVGTDLKAKAVFEATGKQVQAE